MKVGDVVYHKTNPTMGMVVHEIAAGTVTCTWWDGWLHKFVEGEFVPKELLFDGEQQSKEKS